MKKKKNLLQENMERFKTKNLDHINEHILGELPSDKLMKMKWNPLTEDSPLNEVIDPQIMLGLQLQKDVPGLKQHGHVGVSQVKIGMGNVDDILRIFTLGTCKFKPTPGVGKPVDPGFNIKGGPIMTANFIDKNKNGVDDRMEKGATAGVGGITGGILKLPTTYCDFKIFIGKDFPEEYTSIFRTSPDALRRDGYIVPPKGGYESLVSMIKTIFRKIKPGLKTDLPPGGSTTNTGEEIYDPKPSGGFCKRNLDIDWYFDNIIPGKSYLRLGDCGVAVETAQQHSNEFTTGDFASDGNFGPTKVDGMYGPQTIKYIKQVQDFLNLKADGLFGKKTHDALINAIKSSKSMKIDPISPEKSVPQLRILAPVDPTDNAEMKSNALKGKEKRQANRIKRLQAKQGKLKKKLDKIMK